MNHNTIGEFLLKRFMGALLSTQEIHSVLADPYDEMFCDAIRFLFKQEKISLEEIKVMLEEYYSSLNYEHRIVIWPDRSIIMGDICIDEAEVFLNLICGYEKDDAGQSTDVLFIALNPIVG